MKELNFTIEIWRKGNFYLASAPELDFISQGRTFDEAKKNLLEVIQIQYEEMTEMGTFDAYLAECGFIIEGNNIIPQREIIGFEKSVIQMG
jgi:predicted RNase H-like HicB family nuclease